MSDATEGETSDESWLREAGRRLAQKRGLALAIAWTARDRARIGEVALLEGSTGKKSALLIGRGGPVAGETERRVPFVRQRPGANIAAPPLDLAGISRRQLRLSFDDEALRFERVGQCKVLHNGDERDAGELREGDTLAFRNQIVFLVVRRPLALAELRAASVDPAHRFGDADVHRILGESAAAWALRDEIAHAASARAHVLVTGESGSGKELAAAAIHRLSDRHGGPFVSRSAASFPETLVDAEMFGNARNYPNAGMPERPGIVGSADRGTLFLDEVGELSNDLQAHLLRVLDAGGEYARLGDATPRRSNFRLVAATNRDVATMRPDFIARFAVRLRVPPLRERREDIPLLAYRLLDEMAQGTAALARFFGDHGPRVHPSLIEQLCVHDFPLNMRELQELLWNRARSSAGDYLEPFDSPLGRPRAEAAAESEAVDDAKREVTADEVRAALERAGGSATRASRMLRLPSRYALYRLMKKFGIESGERGE